MGALVGKPCERPETVVGDYDIVLAKGRTALEALATGASVILYLRRAIGPLVTDGELERLLPLNFGIRAMTRLFDPVEFAQALSVELARYDSQDAAHVSRRIRAMCGRDRAADEFLSLYNGSSPNTATGARPTPTPKGWRQPTTCESFYWASKRSAKLSTNRTPSASKNACCVCPFSEKCLAPLHKD
jgi:hypothetical protein